MHKHKRRADRIYAATRRQGVAGQAGLRGHALGPVPRRSAGQGLDGRTGTHCVLIAVSMFSRAALRAGQSAASTPTSPASTRKIPIRSHGRTST